MRVALISLLFLTACCAETIRLSRPLVLKPGARLSAKTIIATPKFRGRALIEAAPGAVIENVTLTGTRRTYKRRLGIAPYDKRFLDYYDHNGIAGDGAHGLTIRNVKIREVANFAILLAASRDVTIEDVRISDSGSLNDKGRNNTSGGILLEEGSSNFSVRRCEIRRVRGNGIWTHSLYTSRRNGPGVIEENQFEELGRDAIQAGHATGVRVLRNTGRRIGYPVEIVDYENGGVPVGIDTAGNVDESVYAHNRFTDTNGKCIDLDGFHHGEVRDNTCLDSAHYGIVFNNTNPDMQSESIVVRNNVIDGAKYGGIFVIGHSHTIEGNTMTRLNQAQCGCPYDPAQPDLLRAGIYLGSKAERPAPSRDNVVTNNRISGFGMDQHCIIAAPGVAKEQQKIGTNECSNRP